MNSGFWVSPVRGPMAWCRYSKPSSSQTQIGLKLRGVPIPQISRMLPCSAPIQAILYSDIAAQSIEPFDYLLSRRPETHLTVGHEPGENGKGRHVLIQRRSIELVHRIVSRVMQIKVITTILMQPQRGDARGN
mgnify:FL=1